MIKPTLLLSNISQLSLHYTVPNCSWLTYEFIFCTFPILHSLLGEFFYLRVSSPALKSSLSSSTILFMVVNNNALSILTCIGVTQDLGGSSSFPERRGPVMDSLLLPQYLLQCLIHCGYKPHIIFK